MGGQYTTLVTDIMNHIKKVDLFGIPIWSITMAQTISLIRERILQRISTQHVVVNAGKIVAMQSDPLLMQSVLEADLINADGMAVVWAAKILRRPLPERVTGIDLMSRLVKMAHENKLKCYFLGAKEEVVQNVVDFYSEKYSGSVVAGFRNGYYTEDEEIEVVSEINASGTHLLFVGMSSPRKELFVKKWRHLIDAPFIMGVGGSFDVVAGVTKRAPGWMQTIGMEWFFRFIQEPRRMWKRYLVGNSVFVWMVLKAFFSGK